MQVRDPNVISDAIDGTNWKEYVKKLGSGVDPETGLPIRVMVFGGSTDPVVVHDLGDVSPVPVLLWCLNYPKAIRQKFGNMWLTMLLPHGCKNLKV